MPNNQGWSLDRPRRAVGVKGAARYVALTTPGISVAAASSTSSIITLDVPSPNAVTYTLERSTDGSNWSVVDSTLVAGDFPYTDTPLTESTQYFYRAKAVASNEDSNYSAVREVTTNASASPASYTPLVAQDYAGATLGGDATGLGWYDATYTDAHTLHSNRSLALIAPAFQPGTCPTIWSDWYFGNRIQLPQIVTKGYTLWMRLWLFIPDTFSFGYLWANNGPDSAEYDACAATHGLNTSGHDGNTHLKWLSFDPDNTNGRAYVHLASARRQILQPAGSTVKMYSEQTHQIVEVAHTMPTGRWVSHQMAMRIEDDNTGWMRFWEDDTLVAEKLNIQTVGLSDTGIHKAGLGNYWNGLHYSDGGAGRDTFYLADVIMATDMPGYGAPNGVDGSGNAYIPTSHKVSDFA